MMTHTVKELESWGWGEEPEEAFMIQLPHQKHPFIVMDSWIDIH